MTDGDDDSNKLYKEHIKPLIVKGVSFRQMSEDLGVSEQYIKEIVQGNWIEVTTLETGPEIYNALVSTWERYIEFGNPWHPKLLSLFVLQSYFYRSLPAVFYIGLTGPKSSAKTMVLEILNMLCQRPILTGNVSMAALARKLHEGCTFLWDEADEGDSEKRDMIQAASRQGYRPGSIYLRYDYKKKTYEEVNIYGPKAFSFITDIEDALKSRTVEIETVRVRDDPFGKVLDNLARGIRRLEPLKEAVSSYCKGKLENYAPAQILGVLEHPDFRSEVEDAVGQAIIPRDIELAAICLLVAKIADIEIAGDTKVALEAQANFLDGEGPELAAYIREIFLISDPGKHTLLKDIRDGINKQRKETGEKPIHHKRFRALLRDLGLREGEELKRTPREGRHILAWTARAKAIFASPDGSPPSGMLHPLNTAIPGWFTTAIDTPSHGEAKEGGVKEVVKNDGEAFLKLLQLSRLLSGGERKCFTTDDLTKIAEEFKIDRQTVEKWLERSLREGDVYSPRNGEYRSVKT